MDKPVFIIGLHRTGSTMVNNMINLNSKISMAPDELHVWTPYPWRNSILDLCFLIDLNKKDGLKKMLDMIYSGKPAGAFWKMLKDLEINKKEIYNKLKNEKNIRCMNIVTKILEENAIKNNKNRIGAKYPIHFSGLEKLFKWYPDCKVIHLTRDPRAVYMSKSNDEASQQRMKRLGPLSFLVKLYTMIFVVIEYRWSARIHNRFKINNNYYFLKYEDLMEKPILILKSLCKYLETPFENKMLYPYGKPSSFNGKVEKGFQKERAYRWKEKIKNWEFLIITLLTRRAMIIFEYNNNYRDSK